MQVTVLFFAALRERTHLDEARFDLADGATVATLLAAVGKAHPDLAVWLPRVQVAVNRSIAPAAQALASGDEIALIPPVAGGAAPRRVALLGEPLRLEEVVAAVEDAERGGTVTFTGNVRRNGQRPNVVRLEYEAYAPMALEVMTAIADEIEREVPGVRVAIHHRVGALTVGEAAVIIAAAAAHRAEAFAACRAAIDRLKERVPIWKKEITEDGGTWIGLGP